MTDMFSLFMFSLVCSYREEIFPKTNRGDAYKLYQIGLSAIWEKHKAIEFH